VFENGNIEFNRNFLDFFEEIKFFRFKWYNLLCPIIENHRILYFFLHTFYFFSLINYTLC
jgi:hypothetical protein